MYVTLTAAEISFLSMADLVQGPLVDLLKSNSPSGEGSVCLEISQDEADALRDRLGEYLQREGFDEVYNLNPKGKMLDQLIDKLFVG